VTDAAERLIDLLGNSLLPDNAKPNVTLGELRVLRAQARAAGAAAERKVCEAETVEKAWGAFLSAADAVHADLPSDLLPEFARRLDAILDAPAEEES